MPAIDHIPTPPPPQWVETGKTSEDRSLTPEILDYCKEGTVKFLEALLDKVKWVLGRTKIFMKDTALDEIYLQFKNFHCHNVQKWYRCRIHHLRYKKFRKAVLAVQKRWKGYLYRKKFAMVTRQITVIQANIRGHNARKKYKKLLEKRDASARRLAVGGGWSAMKNTPFHCFPRYSSGIFQIFESSETSSEDAACGIHGSGNDSGPKGAPRVGEAESGSHNTPGKDLLSMWKYYREVHVSFVLPQSRVRGHLARNRTTKIRNARKHGCVLIQRTIRGKLERSRYRFMVTFVILQRQ